MAGPLANNKLVKWLGVIRRGAHGAASEDSRFSYETVSHVCPDIEPDSESSDDDSSDEVIKYQDNPDYLEQEEVVLVTRRNPRNIRRGYQRALTHI